MSKTAKIERFTASEEPRVARRLERWAAKTSAARASPDDASRKPGEALLLRLRFVGLALRASQILEQHGIAADECVLPRHSASLLVPVCGEPGGGGEDFAFAGATSVESDSLSQRAPIRRQRRLIYSAIRRPTPSWLSHGIASIGVTRRATREACSLTISTNLRQLLLFSSSQNQASCLVLALELDRLKARSILDRSWVAHRSNHVVIISLCALMSLLVALSASASLD
jgi:hypothetical protein